MHLERALSDGHLYWSVAKTRREGGKALKDRVLHLGRLDDLTPQRRALRESADLALRDEKVLHTFYAKLAEYGYPVPPAPPSPPSPSSPRRDPSRYPRWTSPRSARRSATRTSLTAMWPPW